MRESITICAAALSFPCGYRLTRSVLTEEVARSGGVHRVELLVEVTKGADDQRFKA
jgi:hypothetical protein